MIVQELLHLQSRHGYLPRQQLVALADRLKVPLYRIHEVASFFPHFHVFQSDEKERREAANLPQFEVTVCRDMTCRLRGSARYLEKLAAEAKAYGAKVNVCGVSCLGRCDRAPAVRIIERQRIGHAAHHDSHRVRALLGRPLEEVISVVRAVVEGKPTEHLPDDRDESLTLSQPPDQWRIDPYKSLPAEQRYASIRRFVEAGKTDALREAERDRIIKALETASLLGMGGAGGRTYKKWQEVREPRSDRKFVICNGDESEPGTFKDRELFLRTPHLIVEGVILAGLVVGAERGYIYIRHEYEEAIAAVQREIDQVRDSGLCGDDILGTRLKFDLEVFVSPGGYICGEQTALVQAIQDERAEPRNRPPELQTNGLWNMPTLLNNVETLAWVPAIVTTSTGDGKWYAQQGATGYKGARFFSISGDVNRPGVYEVPIGIKLGELIDKFCGGMKDDQPIKALALSGPSGGFLPPQLPLDSFSDKVREEVEKLVPANATAFDLRELPLDLGVARKLRLMIGAAIVVYGEGTDLVDQTLGSLKFYQAESCGKCVPCRIGSTKLVEICEDLHNGKLTQADIDRLNDRNASPVFALAQAMAETAICGLGTSAPNPIKSLLAYFPEDVKQYVDK
ncbi:MAG TPA: NADH-ubiquinone oxidoreductase-F iron-sulfur binding region domain-containing protein [Pirellulaceae bacterium]|nr:NADH-ubiquinone oxidoreductase-F iron-sulfur binding region domain-containing protein [Pirellulaceae bacterium]